VFINVSVVPDHIFDAICVKLLDVWDDFEHQHKHCVGIEPKESLKAGTGYNITNYPLVAQQSALSLAKQFGEI